ncbi:MAG: LLM class flavin-dependent oxidoreductase [Dehalococcoidia bacterium]
MKFGLFYLFSEFEGVPQDQIFNEVLEEVEYAEELGFDSVWLPEHHFSVYGTLGNPFIMAAAIAQRTRHIRIGTAVMVLPLQHPLRIAEDAALVDVLSGGRLLFGVGRGYQNPEFDILDVSQGDSREMFQESLDIILKAWTEEGFSYNGRFWHVNEATVYPKPTQKPHPPIFWAAVSPETYGMAARQGYPLLRSPNFSTLSVVEDSFKDYLSQLRAGGYDPEAMDHPVSIKVYVAPTDEEAKRDAVPHALWFFHKLATLLPGAPGRPRRRGYEQYPQDPGKLATITDENLWEWGTCYGSPERVIEQMRTYIERTGTNHVMAWMKIGGLEHSKIMRSMGLFAKDVMPALKKEAGQITVTS